MVRYTQDTIGNKRFSKTQDTIDTKSCGLFFSFYFWNLDKRKTPKPLKYQVFRGLAEKEGFEPSIPLWGIHDFQSCALDQATRLLHVLFGLLTF